jgi:hypothetical protein
VQLLLFLVVLILLPVAVRIYYTRKVVRLIEKHREELQEAIRETFHDVFLIGWNKGIEEGTSRERYRLYGTTLI